MESSGLQIEIGVLSALDSVSWLGMQREVELPFFIACFPCSGMRLRAAARDSDDYQKRNECW